MTAAMIDQRRHEAMTFVLTYARPPDLSLSEDEEAWREYDRAEKGVGDAAMERLVAQLGLTEQVEREIERLGRKPEENTFERRVQDLYDDAVRIFGEPGEVKGSIDPDGWPVLRVGTDLLYMRPHDKSWFTRYRKVGDKMEATLWNRAGIKPLDRRVLDLPPWWRD